MREPVTRAQKDKGPSREQSRDDMRNWWSVGILTTVCTRCALLDDRALTWHSSYATDHWTPPSHTVVRGNIKTGCSDISGGPTLPGEDLLDVRARIPSTELSSLCDIQYQTTLVQPTSQSSVAISNTHRAWRALVFVARNLPISRMNHVCIAVPSTHSLAFLRGIMCISLWRWYLKEIVSAGASLESRHVFAEKPLLTYRDSG